jgi:ribosome-associated protein
VTQPKPSKSARKREQLQLQQLGERLIELTEEELQALPIDERLREAVLAASKIRAHGALRRQKQLSAEDRRAKRVFADAERWRDRIVTEGGEAVRLFCDQNGASAEALEALLGRIHSAPGERIEKGLRRRLFREIHDALMTAAQDDRISR